jgi:hypothetical protein
MKIPMQTIIDLAFKIEGGRRVGLMRRIYDVDFVPILNAEIEDVGFRDHKTINAISINPLEHYYMLKVEEEIVQDQTEYDELSKALVGHGWQRIL